MHSVDHRSILRGTMFGARPTMAGDANAFFAEQHDGSSGLDEVSRGTADQLIFPSVRQTGGQSWSNVHQRSCEAPVLYLQLV